MRAPNGLIRELLVGAVAYAIASLVLARVVPLPEQLTPGSAETCAAFSAGEEPVRVVVATRDLPRYTWLTADMVSEVSVPAWLRATGAATCANEVLGRYALVPLYEKEQFARARLALELPDSREDIAADHAVSIPVRTENAVDGYVSPGTWVDLYGTFRTAGQRATRPFLQRKQILAINSRHLLRANGLFEPELPTLREGGRLDPCGCPPGPRTEGIWQIDNIQTITLAVTAAEAEKLILASHLTGLWLAVLNPAESVRPAPVVVNEDDILALMPPASASSPQGVR